jgi:hypothetical protein
MLQLNQLAGRLRDEGFHYILIGQIVSAPYGVECMAVERIIGA